MNQKRSKGFTLIELMIVVVIVGILATVALPAYREHVIRGNRAAAQAEMMTMANQEQQYLIANRVYADDADLPYSLPEDVSRNYDADITVTTDPPTFTITFTAKGTQAADGNLTLDSEGNKARDGVPEKWDR